MLHTGVVLTVFYPSWTCTCVCKFTTDFTVRTCLHTYVPIPLSRAVTVMDYCILIVTYLLLLTNQFQLQHNLHLPCRHPYRSMQEKAGKVLTEANRAKTFRALLLRQSGCSLAYRWMWVWFRAHAHKNSQTSPKKICSRYRDGKRTEIRIGMEGATAS